MHARNSTKQLQEINISAMRPISGSSSSSVNFFYPLIQFLTVLLANCSPNSHVFYFPEPEEDLTVKMSLLIYHLCLACVLLS